MRDESRAAALIALALCAAAAPVAAAPATGTPALRAGAAVLQPDGTLLYRGATLGQLPLPPAPRRLRVAEPIVEGRRLVHAVVEGAGERRAELVAEVAPPARVIFAGLTGAQGVDGEWSRHLSVAPTSLVLFERREGVARCDGEPVFLFPRRYDFAQGRFRAAMRATGPPSAELVARRGLADAPQGPPLPVFRIVAASTHAGDAQRAAELQPPVEADDGDPATSWSESLGSAGQGEFLTATAPASPYRLQAIQIIPGDATDRNAFARSNRLHVALLALSPTVHYRIVFARDPLQDAGAPRDPYWVVLPEPVATRCATLIIQNVYPGRAPRPADEGRTAIAELRFFTELDFAGGTAQLVRDLAAADAERQRAATEILARLGERAGPSLLPGLAQAEPELLRRIVDVLARAPFAAAAAPLAAALPRMAPPVRQRAIEALAALGPAAVDPLLPLLRQGAEPVRAAVAPLLGQLGGATAQAALIAAAGQGRERVRAAVVEGLCARPTPELLEALIAATRAARRGPRAADLVLAAGRVGRGATAAERAQLAAALSSLWRGLDPAADDFELRYRLLEAIGALDAAGQRALLVSAAAHGDPVLRWVAVRQLARDPRATAALLRALDDADPRARTTAATALAGRRGAIVARGLARRLSRETWPFVGSAIADALASHCGDEALRALRQALLAARPGVAEAALLSLARCRPPQLFDELLLLARQARRRDALRERALALLPAPPTPQASSALLSLFRELRRLALASESGERLAIAAARAVGLDPAAAAQQALLQTLTLDPLPALRAAAARSVGLRCPGAARAAIGRAASGDADAIVRQAAKASAARCRWR